MSNSLFCFIKFGRKSHMENLLLSGQLHFAPLQHFSNSMEQEPGDSFEGAFQIINDEFTEIKCEHAELGVHVFKPIPNSLGKIVQYNTGPFCTYSVFALTERPFLSADQFQLDSRMCAFGDYAVLIEEPIKFLDKVKKELSVEGIKFGCKLIQYEDFKKKGETNTDFFHKDIDYSHQSEYRILIEHDGAINFNIGSIEEFATISTSIEMTELILTAKRKP